MELRILRAKDGVAEEAELKAQKVPLEARNKNWLLR